MAYNAQNCDYDEEQLFEECHEFFRYEIIGLCGCGDPYSVEKTIRNLLNIIGRRRNELDKKKAYDKEHKELREEFQVSSIYDNSLLLFMVYILDDKGILEHGGSVGGAWLSTLGEMYLYVLNNIDLEEE